MPYIEPEKPAYEWRMEVESLKEELAKAKASLAHQTQIGECERQIVLDIQDMLDGTVWEMSMLSRIADMLTDNGYAVADRK